MTRKSRQKVEKEFTLDQMILQTKRYINLN